MRSKLPALALACALLPAALLGGCAAQPEDALTQEKIDALNEKYGLVESPVPIHTFSVDYGWGFSGDILLSLPDGTPMDALADSPTFLVETEDEAVALSLSRADWEAAGAPEELAASIENEYSLGTAPADPSTQADTVYFRYTIDLEEFFGGLWPG